MILNILCSFPFVLTFKAISQNMALFLYFDYVLLIAYEELNCVKAFLKLFSW